MRRGCTVQHIRRPITTARVAAGRSGGAQIQYTRRERASIAVRRGAVTATRMSRKPATACFAQARSEAREADQVVERGEHILANAGWQERCGGRAQARLRRACLLFAGVSGGHSGSSG
eukprot:IDg19151t1